MTCIYRAMLITYLPHTEDLITTELTVLMAGEVGSWPRMDWSRQLAGARSTVVADSTGTGVDLNDRNHGFIYLRLKIEIILLPIKQYPLFIVALLIDNQQHLVRYFTLPQTPSWPGPPTLLAHRGNFHHFQAVLNGFRAFLSPRPPSGGSPRV